MVRDPKTQWLWLGGLSDTAERDDWSLPSTAGWFFFLSLPLPHYSVGTVETWSDVFDVPMPGERYKGLMNCWFVYVWFRMRSSILSIGPELYFLRSQRIADKLWRQVKRGMGSDC